MGRCQVQLYHHGLTGFEDLAVRLAIFSESARNLARFPSSPSMSRPQRYIPEGGALVEITHRVTQGRYLLRPDRGGLVNETVVGVLGRAQRLYSVSAVAVSVLSSHLHLLAYFEDAEQMASFMCHAGGNLSRKIGRLQLDRPVGRIREDAGGRSRRPGTASEI